MTGFEKIFLDTSPVVYYLENCESYYLRVKKFLIEYALDQIAGITEKTVEEIKTIIENAEFILV